MPGVRLRAVSHVFVASVSPLLNRGTAVLLRHAFPPKGGVTLISANLLCCGLGLFVVKHLHARSIGGRRRLGFVESVLFLATGSNYPRRRKRLKDYGRTSPPNNLLRSVMLHVGCGYSLRETMCERGSRAWLTFRDVALLKRLRKFGAMALCAGCRVCGSSGVGRTAPRGQRIMRLIDCKRRSKNRTTGSLVADPL